MNRTGRTRATMVSILIALFGSLVWGGSASASASHAGATGWRVYSDTTYGYSLAYPPTWHWISTPSHMPVFVAPGNQSSCQVNVAVQGVAGDAQTALARIIPPGSGSTSSTVAGAPAVTFSAEPALSTVQATGTLNASTQTTVVANTDASGAVTLFTLELINYGGTPTSGKSSIQPCQADFSAMVNSLTFTSAAGGSPTYNSSNPATSWADENGSDPSTNNWRRTNYDGSSNEYCDSNGYNLNTLACNDPPCYASLVPTGTDCNGRANDGYYQPYYECAEFVARALSNDGLLPGLTPSSLPGNYSNYNGYALGWVPDLYRYLTSGNRGVDIGDNPAYAAPGDVAFYYSGSSLEHVMILVATGQNLSDDLVDGHNEAGWHWQYTSVIATSRTIVHITGARLGYISPYSGAMYANDGSLSAPFTLQTGPAHAVALAGDRIGYVDGSNDFWVKEGGLSASWTLEAHNAQAIALFGNLIGYIDTSGNFWLKQGSLSANWVDEHNNATQIALSGYKSGGSLIIRIGCLDSSSNYWVKEGGLSTSWTLESNQTVSIALAGDRIGFVDNSGTFKVKEGGLSALWTVENTGQTVSIALAGDRIGYVDTGNNFWVKEGGLSTSWTLESNQTVSIALAGDRIGFVDNTSLFKVKEGGLSASWVAEANVARVALPDASTGMAVQ